MFVGDNWDQAAGDWQADIFAHQMRITFIRGIYGDRHIGEHGFGPRGRDGDKSAAIFERIFEVPELAVDFARFHLKVGNRGFQARVPIDEALVAIQQALIVEFNEHFDDRF